MPSKMKSKIIQRLIDWSLVVIALLAVIFASVTVSNRLSSVHTVQVKNAKISKENAKTTQANIATKNNAIVGQVSPVLSKSFDGSLSNYSSMWNELHTQKVISGIESMQGNSKDFYKTTYYNGVRSSVGNIYGTQMPDGSFVLTFTYQIQSLTSGGNTQTKQLLYILSGHKDGDTYRVDKITSTPSSNYN